LISSGTLNILIAAFAENEESSFLKKLFINLLLPISKNQNSVRVLKETNINI
jgi:hypothetical protein